MEDSFAPVPGPGPSVASESETAASSEDGQEETATAAGEKNPSPAGAGPAEEIQPPENFYYIVFEEAAIPARTRDGRDWAGGSPNAYAKLLWGKREIIRTPVDPQTRTPTWPDQPRFNYEIDPRAELVVELWVADAIKDRPLCHVVLRDLDHIRDGGRNWFDCDSGARVTIGVHPPRYVLGLGFNYELRGSEGVRITKVLPRSPAQRLGLKPGDDISKINGKPVKSMDGLSVQSLVNKSSRSGLSLEIRSGSGASRTVDIKEGPIFPLKEDDIPLDQK